MHREVQIGYAEQENDLLGRLCKLAPCQAVTTFTSNQSYHEAYLSSWYHDA